MRKKSKAINTSPDLVEVKVVDRLSALRKEQGLTLRELGSKAGLSDAYLSRLENHKTAVTILSLSRLAKALGTSISVFFEDDSVDRRLVLCRAGKGKLIKLRGPANLQTKVLAHEKPGKLMEAILVDLGTAKKPMEPASHSGEEFNYILEGECELQYGKERIHLTKGDSVYYDGNVPHQLYPRKGKKCLILAVLASKDYLYHGDLSRLLKDIRR